MINFILFTSILDIFKEYGIIITIFVVFILLAYLLIVNSTKRIREQENKIDELYTRLDNYINKFSPDDKKKLAGKFVSYAENSNKIQIQIYHLLQNFCADRVSIYEFHNGGKNLAGVQFKKVSNTYEAVSLQTKPIIKGMQNLPISINPLWNKILSTSDDIIIPSVADVEDTFLKSYLSNQYFTAFYSTILEDYDNTPIGFISIEYYHIPKKLTKTEILNFNATAIKISALINIDGDNV